MFKKAVSAFLVACMLTSTLSFNVFAQNKAPSKNVKRFDSALSITKRNNRKPGQLIVKYKNDKSLLSDKKNVTKHGKLLKTQKDGIALLEVSEDKIAEKMEILKENSDIEYVVPNYIRKVNELPEDFPNDPEFARQWGLQSVNAPQAWAALEEEDLEEVIVAVIDTGLDMNHEDLKDRIVPGYDFVDMDDDPSPGPVDEEHATYVAGILAASTNNGVGMAGTAGTAPVKIMPLRVLEAGVGDDFTIAEAIRYAVDNGADVINMSLGGYGYNQLLTDACNYAFSKNVVVVAAAGNEGMDVENYSPASIPGVITVSAIDVNNNLADFSNFGSPVELTAPGVNILSAIPGDIYESYSGTSAAAPFVSAACALLLSKNPDLSIIEIEQYLTDSAQDIGKAGKDESFGYGLLDLAKAVTLKEITPRLEILNLTDNATVFDVIDVHTRFTYPNKVLKTELYIDGNLVDSIYNESVSESVYNTNMFQNFELDTYKYKDGVHTLKVVLEDVESNIYTKEIKINIRNIVYTGLRVKLTQDGLPVSGAYIEVWNKYQLKGETYYDYCYATSTSKSGTAVIPGSAAPNGNDYIICVFYEFVNGDQLSYAALVEEAVAPGIVEINGDNLIPVTVDTGLTSSEQYLLTNYKFPGSKEGFSLLIPDLDADGSFETYLNPGTYSFEAFGLPSEDSDEPYFILRGEEVEIDSGNFYVVMDSEIDNLAKLNINYKKIHGFTPEDAYFSISSGESVITLYNKIPDISNIPEVYVTPGNYIYAIDLIGTRNNKLAYITLDGNLKQLDCYDENTVTFGGTFTGKIGLEKKKFIPGEELYVDGSVTDSYGNRLVDMDYLETNPFDLLNSNSLISYKTAADKVEFKAIDMVIKALEEPSEPVIPEEPVEFEYRLPITLSLIDSKNNVIKTEDYFYLDFMNFTLPQSIATGNYKMKFVLDLPYLIQDEASLYADRVFTNNAVKFVIELPDKTKATSAEVEAIDTVTGNSYYFYGEDLLDGEMYIPVLKGNYKFLVVASKFDVDFGDLSVATEEDDEFVEDVQYSFRETSAIYVKDGKSPAIYNLSSSQLQKVDFSVKDEEGKTLDNPIFYYLSLPINQGKYYPAIIGINQDSGYTRDIYISAGTYNLVAEVYNNSLSNIECLLSKQNVKIGSNTRNTQVIEFTSDNLTEFSIDKKSSQGQVICILIDPKTGLSSLLILTKGKPVKVQKGYYEVLFLCETIQYGNYYIYVMNAQKDLTKDTTYLSLESDFSMTITPSKSIYKVGETLKTTNVISDRYGNRLIGMLGYGLFGLLTEDIQNSKGKLTLKYHQGKLKLFDTEEKEYVEIPYYDIRAPFIKIKDSFDDVIFTAKSPDFYTHSEIRLDYDWISSGTYKIELTLDIDADGDMSAENTFRVK